MNHFPKAICLVLGPLPLVPAAIGPHLNSKAVLAAVQELALELGAVGQGHWARELPALGWNCI